MGGILRHLASTRLARGTAVGFYANFVQLGIQLASVPILTHQWGVDGFGIWVLLFTVPQFVAVADLGLTTVGANVMIEAMARGEPARAASIYAALRMFTLASGGVLLGAATLVIFGLKPAALDFAGHLPAGEGPRAAAYLCLYGVLALLNGVPSAGFRAADRFASSLFASANMALLETAAGLAVALQGGGLAAVALAHLLVRLAGMVALSALLRRWAPWVRSCGWRADPTELRRLLRPGLAALLYPAGNAVALQGSVMAIGAVGGPAMVPAFAVVRTVTRTAFQFSFRFTIAAMPRYTVHVARGDDARANQLAVLNLAVAIGLTVPAAMILLAFGRELVALWTNRSVVPSFALVAIMAGSMILNSVWSALSNLLLAINRHQGFLQFYLAASIGAVALGTMLVARWHAEGMASAILLLDAAMAFWVWREARCNGIAGKGRLLAAAASLAGELKARWKPATDRGR